MISADCAACGGYCVCSVCQGAPWPPPDSCPSCSGTGHCQQCADVLAKVRELVERATANQTEIDRLRELFTSLHGRLADALGLHADARKEHSWESLIELAKERVNNDDWPFKMVKDKLKLIPEPKNWLEVIKAVEGMQKTVASRDDDADDQARRDITTALGYHGAVFTWGEITKRIMDNRESARKLHAVRDALD